MALFKSQVLSQASGSVGGLTYSRAKGGMYMRARTIPVNSNTNRQAAARAALTEAVTVWTEALTPAQRGNWELYAKNTPTTNRLGDTITLSGQNMFARWYSARQQAITRVGTTLPVSSNEAPTIFDRGTFTTPTIGSAIAGQEITLELGNPVDDVDGWRTGASNAMLVFQGKPCNTTRNYFRGPYRLIAAQPGQAGGVTSFTISWDSIVQNGYAYQAGQCLNMEVAVLFGDGRYTSRRRLAPVTTTD